MSANAYRMLVEAGYDPSEASRISGYTPPPRKMSEVAEENERRFGGGQSEIEELVGYRRGHTSSVYDEIYERRPDIGDCHTRKTVYRKLKFGRGNISERGWIRAGFERNTKTA